MSHFLIDRLIDELGYPEIDADSHADFVTSEGMNVLFFPGDPQTIRDSTDVAVVLPELVEAFGDRLRPGVIKGQRGAAAELKKHYGFRAYPALVFVRGGDYVGAITQVQNWTDYLTEITTLLDAPPQRAPGFEIPVVSA